MVSLKELENMDKKELKKLLHSNNGYVCNQLLKKSIRYTEKAIKSVIPEYRIYMLNKCARIRNITKYY